MKCTDLTSRLKRIAILEPDFGYIKDDKLYTTEEGKQKLIEALPSRTDKEMLDFMPQEVVKKMPYFINGGIEIVVLPKEEIIAEMNNLREKMNKQEKEKEPDTWLRDRFGITTDYQKIVKNLHIGD